MKSICSKATTTATTYCRAISKVIRTRKEESMKAVMIKMRICHKSRLKKVVVFLSLICKPLTRFCITRDMLKNKIRSHPKKSCPTWALAVINRWIQLSSHSRNLPNSHPTQKLTSSKWNWTQLIRVGGPRFRNFCWRRLRIQKTFPNEIVCTNREPRRP